MNLVFWWLRFSPAAILFHISCNIEQDCVRNSFQPLRFNPTLTRVCVASGVNILGFALYGLKL
jgi:hypothetical protein